MTYYKNVNGKKIELTQAEIDEFLLGEPKVSAAEEALETRITRRQLRAELVADGKAANFVQTLIDGMEAGPAKELAQIDWEDAPYFVRNHPLVAALAAVAGYDSATMDTMWLSASKRPV